MQSEYKTVGRHTLVYGLGAALGQLASFIMLPVYTNYLTKADYGVLQLLSTTIDVIAMVAGIGLAAGVFKFYAEFSDPEDKRQVLSTVALGAIGLALVTSLAGIALSGPLTRLVFHNGGGDPRYFRIFFLIYLFQTAVMPAMILFQVEQRSVSFVALNLVKLIASLGLNIYFVVVRRMGLDGVLYSTLLVNGALALLLSAYTFRHVGLKFSAAKFGQMRRFGLPLIVVSLGSFILTFSDRYFLNYFRGTGDVGVYSLAYQFTFVLSTMLVIPFQQIWEPRRYQVAQRPDAGEVFGRMFFYSSILLVGGATGMVALIDDVMRVMVGPAFQGARYAVPVVLIATIFQQWTTYCNVGLYVRNRTSLFAWSSVVAVLTALTLNALLIRPFGMMGAAWATVGAYMVRFGFVYAFAQREYPIPYPWGRVGVLTLVFAGVYVTRALVRPATVSVSLLLSTGLLAASALVTYSILTREERGVLWGAVRRFRRSRVLGTV